MSRRTIMLFTVAVLTVASPCLAAVEMPPDAKGVKEEIPKWFLRREGSDWIVWVAFEGYQPKEKWSENAAPAGSRPLKFMESFGVLHRHEGREGDYLLLGEPDPTGKTVERVVGWVRKDCTVGQEATRVPGIFLHRKAMLVHRKLQREEPKAATGDETAEPDDGGIEMDFDILDAPRKNATKCKSFKLFNIFFVFGETRQATYGSTEEDYVLIGNAQCFSEGTSADDDAEGNPANVVEGWVPKSHLAFWNTREAVAWDQASTLVGANPRRTVPVRVFPSAKAARDALDAPDGMVVADGAVVIRERFDDQQQSIPFKPHHMRYPILEWNTEDLRLTGPGEEPPKYLPRKYKPPGYPSNELLKIGCFGGYGGLTKEEIEDLRHQLRMIREMISTSEILFVIDDTGGMGEYFDDVADVVSKITQNARRTTRTVRIAVAFYNDTDGRPFGSNPVVLLENCYPLTTVRTYGRTVADIVRNHRPVAGGDPPELVFRGIKEAVDGANFSPYARKLVIVIGDCGDRLDDPQNAKDEQTIVDKLLPRGQSPIEFFAVQVCSATRHKHARAFFRQMESIIRLLNERGQDDSRIRRALGSYSNAANAGLVQVLNGRLRDLDRRAAEIDLLLESARAGNFRTEIDAEYEAILRDAGLDFEGLKAREGVSAFREGYVWRYAPDATSNVPQVRIQLMLNTMEIEDIVACMEKLTDTRDRLIGNITIEQALAELMRAATGEERDPNLSFEQEMSKRFGLVGRSPLLRKPIGANFPLRLARSELIEIQHRVDLLKDILEGKQREWKKQQEQLAGEYVPRYVPIGDAKDFDRHFTLFGSTVKWYWIDVEDEFP